MAVDVIPVAVPEYGMTRAEILEYANTMLGMNQSNNELFYTLLFAYVVAMYLAGSQLTRIQYVIVNMMYVLVMGVTALHSYLFHTTFYVWGDYSGLNDVDGSGVWMVYQEVVSNTLLIGLSIWFGRRVRHPKEE